MTASRGRDWGGPIFDSSMLKVSLASPKGSPNVVTSHPNPNGTRSDEVSQRFTSALALCDGDQHSVGVAHSTPALQQFFVVGCLLTLKRKVPNLKVVIGTLTSIWDLHNRLQMHARDDQFVLRFNRVEDHNNIMSSGPWFYGRSQFVLAEYDDALITEEAAEKTGLTLRFVDHVDKLNIKRRLKVRVRVLHHLCNPVKEAFGDMPFEFGSRRFPMKVQLKNDRAVGFYKVCGMMIHPDFGCAGKLVLTPFH
ncbi:hypothetical protein ACLB2K_073103 [Fragaria x ananassa]